MVPELLSIVGRTDLPYREVGLIENVDPKIYKPLNDEDLLVSRRRDGSVVLISHRWVVQRLSQIECDGICVLLCTAEFDDERFIMPYKVVDTFFSAMPKLERATVVVPEKEQCTGTLNRWRKIARRTNCVAFSPYRDSKLEVDLSQEQLVYLDCIGFTLKHEEFFKEKTEGIVLSARRISLHESVVVRCTKSRRRKFERFLVEG